ncbi:MAG: phosphosulfolactate synthase [Actinobacteria bacterium]|nr:phosphosulfolactate synthase [Actinomycetota bacterium]
MRTDEFLDLIGVQHLGRLTSPFDPGYDPITVKGHLEQSGHLMANLKLSMACWMVAGQSATQEKIASAVRQGVPTLTGGGPFEVATAQGQLPAYLDLCADLGINRIECGEGFTELGLNASDVVAMASARGLEVQYELGEKHGGAFSEEIVGELVDEGQRWLDAGALQIVVEARESAERVGLFDGEGHMNPLLADRFVEAFGMEKVTFEAPNKASQFAFMDHFGPMVRLSNVRLEELLRVEIYRRGLHSDAFSKANLRPNPVGIPQTTTPAR